MNLKYNELTIVVISFKSNENVKNLLSLIRNSVNIIIVENSNDHSLKEYYSKDNNIKFISKDNIGFGPAINEAAKLINTKYFFVLNPDLSKINEDIIINFLKYSKQLNDNFGVLGPRYKNLENDKSLKQSDKNQNINYIECISGAAMFFLKKSFDSIGGFDENIFLYFEENDICKRLNKKNKKVFQINSIEINHERGNSFIPDNTNEIESMKLNSIWHFSWSKFYYLKKHYTYLCAIIIIFPIILRSTIKILIHYFFKNEKDLKKYKYRLSGLTNSIILNKSFKRPEL